MKTTLRQRRLSFAAPAGGGRRADLAGLAALLTVAVYGLGSLTGLLHLALTSHELCLDHGAMVHAGHDDGHAGHGAGPAATAEARRDDRALARTHASQVQGHDHCTVADHLRGNGLQTPTALHELTSPPVDSIPLAPATSAHRSIALLGLAPKHSPPAAA